MIKINFIAQELAQKQNAKIRNYYFIIYSIFWIISIISTYHQFHNKQTLINSYTDAINIVKSDIDKLSPQVEQAVLLYQQRNQQKKQLCKVTNLAVESSFIRESIENLARAIPDNFWLEEIRISTSESKISDDNNKGKKSPVKSMRIKGNLFWDTENKNPKQVQQFKSKLQKHAPFSLAQSRMNLNDIRVRKLDKRYYHNFVIEFAWFDIIL